jgi:hypothetical protein
MAATTRPFVFEYQQRWAELAKFFDPPLSEDLIAMLDQRDKDLEDALNMQPIIFDRDAGAPVRSKVWTSKSFTRVRAWSVELTQDDAGDDIPLGVDFTIELHINGVYSRELILPAGEVYIEYDSSEMPLPHLEAGARLTLYAEDTTFDLVSTVWL